MELPPSSPTSSVLGSTGGRTPPHEPFFSSDGPPSDTGRSAHTGQGTAGGRGEDDEVPMDDLRRAALGNLETVPKVIDVIGEKVREQFERFLWTYRAEGSNDRYYLRQVEALREFGLSTVYVDWAHLRSLEHLDDGAEGSALVVAIRTQYYRFLPFLQRALRTVIRKHEPSLIYGNVSYRDDVTEVSAPSQTTGTGAPASSVGGATGTDTGRVFQLAFYGLPLTHKVRELRTDTVGTLLTVSGTVTRTSEVRPELYRATFKCDECMAEVSGVEQVFRYTEPYMCPNPQCANRVAWTLLPAKSQFVDWQRVRVQENPGEIPTGSMPRTLDVIVRGDVVDRAKAGDKCMFTGCPIVIPDVAQLGLPGVKPQAFRDRRDQGRTGEGMNGAVRGLRALGVRDLTYRIAFLAGMVQEDVPAESVLDEDLGHSDDRSGVDQVHDEAQEQQAFLNTLTSEEIEELSDFAHSPDIFEKLVASIAPTVWGHEIVKTGLLLQLMGGVHKQTVEGIKLRGDINVCIVGDPSTSKSQFLKYVCGFMPRTVYTSGKASSAAGLTAAVVKDEETHEYTIEAGALMLADNGICAIDEFDKMDLRDQVAIHEAMEQQTISIAKAGIHATLNARTSILAAANPVGGRYNRKASLRANINMSAPIMSRFDLFFVVLDECNEQADTRLADHIVALHMDRDEAIEPPLSTAQLRRYIMWARTFKPHLNDEAKAYLVDRYRELRANDAPGAGRSSYRITVRQLESLIRLSEAIARAHCVSEVTPEFVRLAYNLLRQSIVHVDRDDVDVGDDDEDEGFQRLRQPRGGRTASNRTGLEVLAVAAARARTESHNRNGTAPTEESQNGTQTEDGGRARTKITYDKYMHIMRMLVQFVQAATHDNDESSDTGVAGEDLVRLYLEAQEDMIDSEEALTEERRLVRKVIRRMVRDHILLQLRGTAGSLREAQRGADAPVTYVLHPNAIVGN